MIFMGGLTNRKLTVYIGRWLMTRKIVEGKPWVFTTVILVGTYIMSVFIGAFAPIFLFWPVLYGVFEDVGFKKTDNYPKIMIIAVVIAALIGFPVPPYMVNGLALLGNYRGLLQNFPVLMKMSGVMASNAIYFIGCFVMGLLLLIATILVMKLVFKPDVTPLENITIEMLERNPLPSMNKAQKTYGVFLIIFIFCMLVPSLLPTLPVLSFLNTNSYVIPTLLTTLLCLISFEDGPNLKINEVMGKDFAWPTFLLCTSAILIGGVLTNEVTGITPFLNTVLSPIFSGMSGFVFTIALLLVAIVLTNICNSLVIGMILQPVVLTYCVSANVNPAPIITVENPDTWGNYKKITVKKAQGTDPNAKLGVWFVGPCGCRFEWQEIGNTVYVGYGNDPFKCNKHSSKALYTNLNWDGETFSVELRIGNATVWANTRYDMQKVHGTESRIENLKIDIEPPTVSCYMSQYSGNIYGLKYEVNLSDEEPSSGFGDCSIDLLGKDGSENWTSMWDTYYHHGEFDYGYNTRTLCFI